MSKLLLAFVVGLALMVWWVWVSPTAQADGGPHQGALFGTKPDYCAACHRVHTAKGTKLLKETNQETLCYACHGSGATGANTNVTDGVYIPTSLGLKGGGLSQAPMDPDLTGAPTSAAVTSTHVINGTPATAWGGGAISTTPNYGTTIALTCSHCHNPHGNGQYRILRRTPTDGYGTSNVTLPDEATKDYDISYTSTKYRDTSYSPVSISLWCAQCHTRYGASGGSGNSNSGDAIFKYRHMTVGLADGCLKCHVAHGTTAVMGKSSGSVPLPNETAGGGSLDSRLLHVNNRGVCSQCHLSSTGGVIGSCTKCHGYPKSSFVHNHAGALALNCEKCHIFSASTHNNGQVDNLTDYCGNCHN